MNPIRLVIVMMEIMCISYAVHGFQASTRSVEIETEYNKAVSGQSFACPFKDTTCVESSYATFDGTCNNLVETLYGSVETPYKRILSAQSDPGSDKRTLASDGVSSLPNPRDISNQLVDDDSLEPIWTHFFTTFGQFLSHDLTSAASSTSDAATQPSCTCDSTDSACFSIAVTNASDVLDTTCMEFVRSAGTFKDLDCSDYGERENLNLVNSFIDASNVYGNSLERSNGLRAFAGGNFFNLLVEVKRKGWGQG